MSEHSVDGAHVQEQDGAVAELPHGEVSPAVVPEEEQGAVVPEEEQDAPPHDTQVEEEVQEAAGPDPERMAEYTRHLETWKRLLRSQAEQNYHLAMGAAEAVSLFLAAWPGRAQRAVAVLEMAKQLREQDDESLFPPDGTTPERWDKQTLARAQAKVQKLLQGAAVCRLLFDCEPGLPIPTAKGNAKQATKGNPALPWGTVRELAPLVRRTTESEFCEEWAVLPGLEQKVLELAADVRSGLPRASVVSVVRKLLGKDDAARPAPGRDTRTGKGKPPPPTVTPGTLVREEDGVEKPGEDQPLEADHERDLEEEEKAQAEQDALAQAGAEEESGQGEQPPPEAGKECRAPRSLLRGEDGREDPVQVAGMWYSMLEDLKDPSSCVLEFLEKLIRDDKCKWDEPTRQVLTLIDAAMTAPERNVKHAILVLRRKSVDEDAAAA